MLKKKFSSPATDGRVAATYPRNGRHGEEMVKFSAAMDQVLKKGPLNAKG